MNRKQKHVMEEALGALIEAQGEAGAVDFEAVPEAGSIEREGQESAGYMEAIASYAGDASPEQIFAQEGTPFSARNVDTRKLAKVAGVYRDVIKGRVSLQTLMEAQQDSYVASALVQETMLSSEFSTLLGSTLDRVLLAQYETYQPTYRQFLYADRQVRDFRAVGSVRRSGGTGLSQVREGSSYPVGSVSESSYTYSLNKYGKIYSITWESLVNDDLDAFSSMPTDMADDAIQEEMYFASSLYVNNTTLYAANHAGGDGSTYSNTTTDGLTKANLQSAIEAMVKFPGDATDGSWSKPVNNMPALLVVPPALAITAAEILGTNFVQYVGDEASAAVAIPFPTMNGLQGMLTLLVDPMMPVIDSTNGHTSWHLFADPSRGRHAAEVGFLRGFVTPQVFRRASGVIGTGANGEGFADDSIAWKVRHVFGGSHANAAGNWRFTYRSTGAGA